MRQRCHEATGDVPDGDGAFSSSCGAFACDWTETWSGIERTLMSCCCCCCWWRHHCPSCRCWSCLCGECGGDAAVKLWSGHSFETSGCSGSGWRRRCRQLNWGNGDGDCLASAGRGDVAAGSDSSAGRGDVAAGSDSWEAMEILWRGCSWLYARRRCATSCCLEPFTDKSRLLRCSCKTSRGRRASNLGDG